MGSLSLLQGIFPPQGLNPGLPHCRWILYQLSHTREAHFSNLKIFLIVNAVTWFKIHTCKGLTKRNPPTFISNHWVPPKVTVVHLYSYTLCIVSCCSGPKSFLTPRPHGLQHARLLCPVYKQLSLCILPLLCNDSMLYVLCTSCYSTLNMSWKVFSLVHKERYLFYGIQAIFSFFQQCF